LGDGAGRSLEGVYEVNEGRSTVGLEVVLKWAGGGLSLFSPKDAVLGVFRVGKKDSSLVIAGLWRMGTGSDAGTMTLDLAGDEGGALVLHHTPPPPGGITIRGTHSTVGQDGRKPVTLTYKRPLFTGARSFQIIAHRAGGRNSDTPPASENSIELALLAERFGATGVEIDVQLTSDGVPVIFHDEYLNLRLNRKSGLVGKVSDYTFAQLETFVRLVYGEKIPSLRTMLSAILHGTSLNFVWLDSKPSIPVQTLVDVQREYRDSARAAGRSLTIALGLPTTEKVDEYLQLPAASKMPVLCELTLDDVRRTSAEIWAPRWTLGTQNSDVAQMHAEGRKAFVWTLDAQAYIIQFLRDGAFDGILTNYPSLVAYYYYAQ
jgi:glycerophosphoryl diester phosphodiesterase